MIVQVLDMGRDGAGLTRYLFGPGKSDEHTNQRILAGSPEIHAEWGNEALSSRQATHVGRLLESSWRRQYAPELALAGVGSGGISRENLTDKDGALPGQKHIFHVVMSLAKEDGPYTDEQWRQVAETYMGAMGFIGNPDHPDASWFAVHHGASSKGNDHIHIAMCTTLRDGSNVNVHNSGIRSQDVRREHLEKLPFVKPAHDKQRGTNTPRIKGITAAEHNIARKRAANGTGSPEADRVLLQRIVRAAATQANTEAEFINNVLSHRGVRIEPARWEPGNRDHVTGYKVGLKNGISFTASNLAADLTLQKLRPSWNETPESAQLARDLWAGDATKLDPLHATRDVPDQLEQAARHLADFNDHLARLDPHDKAGWTEATSSLAGTAAVLATGQPAAFQQHGGRAADILARQALEDAWNTPAPAEPKVPTGLNGAELATRHVQLALRASGTNKHSGWIAVIQQITRATSAIQDAKIARGEHVGATTLRQGALTAFTSLEQYVTGTAQPVPAPRVESEAERLLREQRDRDRAPAATPTSTMSEDARRAREIMEHGQRPSGQPTTPTKPTGTPATPGTGKPTTPDNQRTRGRGRR